MNITPILLCVMYFHNTPQAVPQVVPQAEAKQFDFWVGNWKASGESFGPGGKAKHTDAENSITHTMAGHVIQEKFKMPGLNGMSVSVYDPSAKLWRQTWVDDNGGYIALTGTFADGKMTLRTIPRQDRPNAASRMVFSNINSDSFDWDWQSSQDAGVTWKTAWHLHYTRVKN